jgi:hypothetical protein
MAETTKSYKPIYWALVIVAFIALAAWAYTSTRNSNRAVQQASAAGTGVGTAYDPTTGATVPAGAAPGALGTGGPPPAIIPNATDVNAAAGGTTASVNPNVAAAPGPVASGTAVPPADLNR